MSVLPAGFVSVDNSYYVKKGQEICLVFKRKILGLDPVPNNCPDYTAEYLRKFPASEYLTLSYNNLEHYLTLKKVFSKDNRKYFIYYVDNNAWPIFVIAGLIAVAGVAIGFLAGQFLSIGVRSPLGNNLGAGLFMLAVVVSVGVFIWYKFIRKRGA